MVKRESLCNNVLHEVIKSDADQCAFGHWEQRGNL